MSVPEFINEPILVQACFLPDGRVLPTAFIWRERTRHIADHGRQWEETVDDTAWRCYLCPHADRGDVRATVCACGREVGVVSSVVCVPRDA